jgi:carboxylate-amine ligase
MGQVVAAMPGGLRRYTRVEFHTSQLEVASPVRTDLADLGEALAELRRAAAAAAPAAGARLLAVGTAPMATPLPAISAGERYARMAERFGALAGTPGLCGCHVHVGVPDRDTAVQVGNHVRAWLPVLQALTANSPFFAGRDTGYASWRSVLWRSWPSAGPTPFFGSVADFDRAVAELVAAGVLLDEGMVYWYVRPSARYPTVEVRVGDVCLTVSETLLVAALVRALVATALRDVHAGRRAPAVNERLLAAAHWRAGRDGLEGLAVDPVHGGLQPARRRLQELLWRVRPALIHAGDLALVRGVLDELSGGGSGAARQRRAYRRRRTMGDVLRTLEDETVRPPARHR